MAQLGADVVGGGGDEAAHLVERLGPGLAGRDARDSQNPHRLDVSVPRLGLTVGVAGLRARGRGDGVLRIALAASASTLPVGPVDLDDSHRLGVEVAGQPGAVGAGALDTDDVHLAEAAQPGEQAPVAGGVVSNDSTPSSAPWWSKAAATWTSRWVSTPPVIRSGKVVIVIPSLVSGWGGTAPPGRRTGQRRACTTGS